MGARAHRATHHCDYPRAHVGGAMLARALSTCALMAVARSGDSMALAHTRCAARLLPCIRQAAAAAAAADPYKAKVLSSARHRLGVTRGTVASLERQSLSTERRRRAQEKLDQMSESLRRTAFEHV